MNKLKKLMSALFNKETISYIIFGVLTTVINILAFILFDKIKFWPQMMHLTITNCLAWVVAVVFAFVTNKLYVFNSKSMEPRLVLREFFVFVSARLVSLGIDTLGLILIVRLFSLNAVIAKITMNIIVIIMNYVISKVYIFKSDKENS